MTKQNELDTLLACAKTLGADSYCGPWLLDQIPAIEADIRSDILPNQSWTETRRLHDEMLADARRKAAEIIEVAEEKAKRLATQAETHAKTVRDNLRRDLQRAADIL
jgi:cell division septum initiation protein DivIVA